MTLRHDSSDCTGRWGVRSSGYRICWRCSLYGAIGRDSIENREAAILENLMGNTLEQLAAEGRELLDGERSA